MLSRFQAFSWHFSGSGNVSTETAAELSDTGCSSGRVEMPIAKTLSNVASVDKPISISFDGLCLPTVVVDSSKRM